MSCLALLISDPSSYNAFSYQSGGAASDPTSIAQSYSNDPEVAGIHSGFGNEIANAWETRLGWRVDLMAPAAYILGPVTGMFALVSLMKLSHSLSLRRTMIMFASMVSSI